MLRIILMIMAGTGLMLIAAWLFSGLYGRKRMRPLYWDLRNRTSAEYLQLQDELRIEEQVMEMHKEKIRIATQFRNVSKRIVNELTDLYEQMIPSGEVYPTDFQMLRNLHTNLSEFTEETSRLIEKSDLLEPPRVKEDLKKLLDLIGETVRLLETLTVNIDQTKPVPLLPPEVKEKANQLNEQITHLHTSFIEDYQNRFSAATGS